MCGIAGIWNLDGSQLELHKLKKFTDSMLERGPDGSGYELYLNETLGLGHRRLSILDLSEAGHQPMHFADDRYSITFNGEIFNFLDIRGELKTKGYKFRSDSDTEVVLAAYHEWGAESLNKFNGMWALAILDTHENKLFMARDRFGIKPYYYLHIPGKILAFASETRAFKNLEGYNRSMDDQMVGLQASGARIHGSGYSIYKGIHSILPGHYSVVTSTSGFTQKRWWHINDHLWTDVPATLEEQAEKYYEIFQDACRIRLISDVKVATALSGGLDSSSVYSVVNALLKKGGLDRVPADSQKAVVVTFPGLENDERQFAEKVVEFTKGEAIYLPQEYPNLAEQITKDTQIFDGLNASPITAISGIYRGMREQGITVSMDGHGVDEMLYGYRDMMYNLFNYYYKKRDLKHADMMRDVIFPTYAEHDQNRVFKNLEMLMKSAKSPISGLKSVAKKILKRNAIDRTAYQSNKLLKPIGEPYDFSHLSYPEQIIYNETFVETLPDIFRNFDLAGMMNSVEIRMPFMDWRLVAFQFSLPIESKIGNGFNKLVLRQAMKGKMAEEIRTRRLKIGISSPIANWFAGDLKEWSLDLLSKRRASGELRFVNNEFIHEFKIGIENKTLSLEQAHSAWLELNCELICE